MTLSTHSNRKISSTALVIGFGLLVASQLSAAYSSAKIPVRVVLNMDYAVCTAEEEIHSGHQFQVCDATVTATLDGEQYGFTSDFNHFTSQLYDGVNLFVGKEYEMQIYGSGYGFISAGAELTLPQGYIVKTIQGSFGTGTTRFRIQLRESYGEMLSVASHQHGEYPHEIAWNFGLGSLITGQAAGAVRWQEDLQINSSAIPDSIYALGSISYEGLASPEVDVVFRQDANGDNYPFQIRTASVFVEIDERPSGPGFKISYFRPWDYADTVNTVGEYDRDVGAADFCFYEIMKVDTTKYRVFRQYGDDSTNLMYEISRGASDWAMKVCEANQAQIITDTLSTNLVTWSGTDERVES